MLQNNIAIYKFFHYPSSYFSALKKEISKKDYFKNTDKDSVNGKTTRDLYHYKQNVTLQKEAT